MFKVCSNCKIKKLVSEFYSKGRNVSKKTLGYYKHHCKKCERQYDKESKHNINTRYADYKKRAKKKNLPFNISIKEFKNITSKPCSYCGGYSTDKITFKQLDFVGLDRIVAIKGYTKNNVAPCCTMCNNAKWHLSKKMFLAHVKKIYAYNNK